MRASDGVTVSLFMCSVLFSHLSSAFRARLSLPAASSIFNTHLRCESTPSIGLVSRGVGFGNVSTSQPKCDRNIDIGSLNLEGLKKEITRGHLRAYKKCAKATERYQKALKTYEEILSMENPSMEVNEIS